MAALSGARVGVCLRPLSLQPVSFGGGVGAAPPLSDLRVSLTTLECVQSLYNPHPLLPARIDQTQMAPLHGRQKP